MALLPIPRSTPIASKLASAPTSSPLMDLLPLVPPALVLLHQAVKLLRLVPSLAPRLVVCAAHYHIDEIPLANIFQPPMPLALSPAPALVLQRPALPRPTRHTNLSTLISVSVYMYSLQILRLRFPVVSGSLGMTCLQRRSTSDHTATAEMTMGMTKMRVLPFMDILWVQVERSRTKLPSEIAPVIWKRWSSQPGARRNTLLHWKRMTDSSRMTATSSTLPVTGFDFFDFVFRGVWIFLHWFW